MKFIKYALFAATLFHCCACSGGKNSSATSEIDTKTTDLQFSNLTYGTSGSTVYVADPYSLKLEITSAEPVHFVTVGLFAATSTQVTALNGTSAEQKDALLLGYGNLDLVKAGTNQYEVSVVVNQEAVSNDASLNLFAVIDPFNEIDEHDKDNNSSTSSQSTNHYLPITLSNTRAHTPYLSMQAVTLNRQALVVGNEFRSSVDNPDLMGTIELADYAEAAKDISFSFCLELRPGNCIPVDVVNPETKQLQKNVQLAGLEPGNIQDIEFDLLFSDSLRAELAAEAEEQGRSYDLVINGHAQQISDWQYRKSISVFPFNLKDDPEFVQNEQTLSEIENIIVSQPIDSSSESARASFFPPRIATLTRIGNGRAYTWDNNNFGADPSFFLDGSIVLTEDSPFAIGFQRKGRTILGSARFMGRLGITLLGESTNAVYASGGSTINLDGRVPSSASYYLSFFGVVYATSEVASVPVELSRDVTFFVGQSFKKSYGVGPIKLNVGAQAGANAGLRVTSTLDTRTASVSAGPFGDVGASVRASAGISGIAEVGVEGSITLLSDSLSANASIRPTISGNTVTATANGNLTNTISGPNGKITIFGVFLGKKESSNLATWSTASRTDVIVSSPAVTQSASF